MEIPNRGVKMTKLKLIKSKPVEEQIAEELEEIQLPLFDIITHREDEEFNWFEQMIADYEETEK